MIKKQGSWTEMQQCDCIFFNRFGKNEITRAEADRYLQGKQRNWRNRKPEGKNNNYNNL
jgi:hypothetical protein